MSISEEQKTNYNPLIPAKAGTQAEFGVQARAMQNFAFYAYILASAPYGTLYTGSTDDLARRLYQHREKIKPGFTAKYNVAQLVWYEQYETRGGAFRRERRIKEWRRQWKIELIESMNPTWADLYEDLMSPLGFR